MLKILKLMLVISLIATVKFSYANEHLLNLVPPLPNSLQGLASNCNITNGLSNKVNLTCDLTTANKAHIKLMATLVTGLATITSKSNFNWNFRTNRPLVLSNSKALTCEHGVLLYSNKANNNALILKCNNNIELSFISKSRVFNMSPATTFLGVVELATLTTAS